MSGTMLNIKSSTLEMSFERSNVAKFYFVNGPTAIKEIGEKASVTYRQSAPNQLTVFGLTVQDGIVVCNLAGHVFNDCVERNGEEAIIDLNRCPQGIYIIKIGKKQTIKMIKK